MKNLSVSKRNSSAASVATKAFAWILSIMLVVTGLSPSLAANNKAAGKGVTNTVTKSEAKDDASDKAYKNSKKAGDKEKATLPEENKKKENNKASKADKKPADINKKDADSKGKPANNNDKVQKAKAKGSREGASPARLSKKKAAALKKEAADEADAAVWRGFGAYYANLAAHNKKSQNINPKDSLKTKAAKSLKNSLDTKINKKSQKNIDYKKTSKMYNKKEKKGNPILGKEEIVDLNSSGSVKAKLKFDSYYVTSPYLEPYWTYLLNKVSLFIDKPNNIAIDRDGWLKLVERCGGKVDGGHIEWPAKRKIPKTGKYMEVNMDIEAGIRLPKNSNELFKNCCFRFNGLYDFRADDVGEMKEMFKFDRSDHEPYKISGIENWNVSNVADFTSTFEGANIGELNLSNWKLHPWLSSHINKMADAFKGCRGLGCLALPKGFNTTISSRDNNNVKIVKVEKGFPVRVRRESYNLKGTYKIDDNGTAIYHIYNKDKYAGVTFDKDGGDSEAWSNHAVAKKTV